MQPAIVLCTLLVLGGTALATLQSPTQPAARRFEAVADEVAAATRAWAAAYDSRNPQAILATYAPDAVFWGTTSPILRDTPSEIAEYFRTAPSRPDARVGIDEMKVRVWGDVAVSTGSYTFTDIRDGQPVRRPSRFSFVFRRIDGRWLIEDHHSSAAPAVPQQASAR